MKKTIIALGLLLSASTYAEITNLHFYAQKEHFKEGIIESEISSDVLQLVELTPSKNGVKNAPIHVSVLDLNIDALKIFAKHKKYIDVKNSYDQTALMLSLKMGLKEYAKILIDGGASIESVDTQGNSVDAYANVGEINLSKLYKNRKRNIVSPEIEDEDENVSDFSNEEIIDSEYYARIDRVEENLIDIVNLIGQHDSVIENIKNSKVNVKDELEKANKDIITLKNNLNKQAKILIPIIRSNKNTINAIDKQMTIITEKAKALSDKIGDINNLREEVIKKLNDVKNIEDKLDKTKESLLKPELEQILLETPTKITEISEVDLLGEDPMIEDIDYIEQNSVPIVLIEDEEKTLIDKITIFVEKNLALIGLLASLAAILLYITIKYMSSKSKKKTVDNTVEDDDDEHDENASSQLNKTLDQIEIEESVSDDDLDDITFGDIDLDK